MKSKAISLGIASALIIAGLFFYFYFPAVRAQSPSTPAAAKATAKPPAAVLQTYTLYGGFWRVSGGFVSTIRIKNELVVAPLDVTPVLYMADGVRYELPSVHLATAGVAFVNINDALAKVPARMADHLSQFGSVELHWQYTSAGHIVASVEMLNVPQSLIFIAPLNGVDPAMPGGHTLEGLWWRHDPGVDGYVSVANMTDKSTEVSIQTVDARGGAQPGAFLQLAGHTTKVLRLWDLVYGRQGAENQAGGLRIKYNGPMGAIMVTGGLENVGEGYSANMPFWFHDAAKDDKATRITYAAVGLMAGQPDPMMGFPEKTRFTPYLTMRNTSANPLLVHVRFNTMSNGAPVFQAAPPIVLVPFESRQVDMEPILAGLGLKDFNGNLNLRISYKGRAGDLVTATGSVDQTGTYVFEVEPQGIGQSQSKGSGPWTTANGFDTMYNLLNPTNQAEDLVAIFYYGDGSGNYQLPVHLAAHGSTMIDMAVLRMNQQPDANGNTIPATKTDGSVVFQSAKGRMASINVVISAGVYNPVTATCGQGCIWCYGYSNFDVALTEPSSELVQSVAQATDSEGYVDDMQVGTWTSDDTTIATVDSSGFVSAIGPGSTSIDAEFAPIIVYTGQYCYYGQNLPCPQDQPSVSSGIAIHYFGYELSGVKPGPGGVLVGTWVRCAGPGTLCYTIELPATFFTPPQIPNFLVVHWLTVTVLGDSVCFALNYAPATQCLPDQ
ncbi:MAG TPA: hypothetical protein VGX94_15070 [Terriglobia bacterium]|nr:hypothetical protein [Terriglobia bacterium]